MLDGAKLCGSGDERSPDKLPKANRWSRVMGSTEIKIAAQSLDSNLWAIDCFKLIANLLAIALKTGSGILRFGVLKCAHSDGSGIVIACSHIGGALAIDLLIGTGKGLSLNVGAVQNDRYCETKFVDKVTGLPFFLFIWVEQSRKGFPS